MRHSRAPTRDAVRAPRTAALVALGLCIAATDASGQRRITLAEAVAATERASPEIGSARADSAAASAALSIARAYPNPALSLDYTQSVPRYHVVLEQPIDYPAVRRARVRAAERDLTASALLLGSARASLRYRVEVAYVAAAGAVEVMRLSRENVATGAALVRSVRARRDAGDASDLDVAVAEVALGQLRSAALTDSLAELSALLVLQSLMGLPISSVEVVPADSLASLDRVVATLPVLPPSGASAPLRVAIAEEQLAAEQERVTLAVRSRFPTLAVRAGFEQGDPSQPGILPTVGVTVPIPIFSRGRGELAQARAAALRATAALEVARRESAVARATAERQREVAQARLAVDRATVAAARTVAALSLTAYREGAYPLATVLEAQRSARDALRQYVEDIVTTLTAGAAFRLAVSAGGAVPAP